MQHGLIYRMAKATSQRRLTPLKKVQVNAILEGALATVKVSMTYFNPHPDSPIECTYELPMEQRTLLCSLQIKLGDKIIDAEVQERAKANLNYAETIASGDLGLLAQRVTEGQQYVSIKIGNLMPMQEATVTMSLVQPVQIVGSSYEFLLPTAFYPDYKKLDDKIGERWPFAFAYSVIMKSASAINLVSKPESCQMERHDSGKYVTLFSSKPERELRVFYRTNNMGSPSFIFGESPKHPGKVACSVSFVPTWEPPQPQDVCSIIQGEPTSSGSACNSNEMLFIFLLDRSGSMNGPRMVKANEALKLFIRSLPVHSKFAICSFGSTYDFLRLDEDSSEVIFETNEKNAKEAILRVGMFHANFGGTDIAAPLLEAIEAKVPLKKKVFILTDGKVKDP